MRLGSIAAIAAVAAVVVVSSGAFGERGGGRVIEELRVSGDDACMQVSVGFSFPVRYVKHFPESRGEELRIYLAPIVVDPLDRDEVSRREALRPDHYDDRVPLIEAVYEGDVVGGRILTLLFSRAVTYRVNQGADFRSLLVSLPGADAATECPKLSSDRSPR